MKKPAPGSSQAAWAAYGEWVRAKLADWDPADDRGGPDVYTPRYNGVRAIPNYPVNGADDVGHDDDGSD
jgi:hypothetical protein